MVHFGLCDTDTELLSRLAAFLHDHFGPCQIEYMYGPDALEVFLYSGADNVDVLLTEIELRGKNAIQLIRAGLKDSSPVRVLYLTSKPEYCTDVYETRHDGFLLKPLRADRVERDVRRALQNLERDKQCGIILQKSNGVHILHAPSLIYVEGHGRLIRVVTDQEMLEAYEKIGNLLYQMDGRFLQCHKSYVVNMDRVSKYTGNSFFMDNGAVIPISQSRRKEARARFLDYIGGAAAVRI